MIPNFVVTPYVGVGPIRLGMTGAQLHALLGPPNSSRRSRFGPKLIEHWRQEDLTVVLSGPQGGAAEISFGSHQAGAEVHNVPLFSRSGPDTYRDLCRLDGAPREDVGMTVQFRLGITLDGFLATDQDQRVVTVFAAGTWDEGDPRLTPVAPA